MRPRATIFIIAVVLLGLYLVLPGKSWSQIPNADFEDWTGGEPDGWLTNNVQGILTPVTESTDPFSGFYAIQGTVVSFSVVTIVPVFLTHFPETQRPTLLSGHYKFAPVGGDTMVIAIALEKNNVGIGGGRLIITATAGSYTLFQVPITYIDPAAPDTCAIDFSIGGAEGGAHVGSTMIVDDLSLSGGTAGVAATDTKPLEYALQQNYPNPFNPTTNIRFSISQEQHVTINVFDVLGRLVATPLDHERMSAGTFDIPVDLSHEASGTYFYRIEAGNFVRTRAMALIK